MISQFFPICTFLLFTIFFGSFSVLLKSAIATNISLGMFSVSCAVLYFFLNSPDVSMTEVAIGVFLNSAFYLMTIRICKIESFDRSSLIKCFWTMLLFLALFLVVYFNFGHIGTFGNIMQEGSSTFYLLSSYKDYKIPNVITVILASFRGFDTMGETIIILTSGIGIHLILKFKNGKYSYL